MAILPKYTGGSSIFENVTTDIKYLPKQNNWPVATRDTLNNSAETAKDQQLSVAAENAPLRIIYGTTTIGAQIACALIYRGEWYILCVWGEGECDTISEILIDDKPYIEYHGTVVENYIGTTTQDISPLMILAFSKQVPPVTYTDTLPGICYSVVKIIAGKTPGFPNITATIKGRKIYDPRNTTTTWSNNPALCLADFITNTTYGMDKTVNYDSVGIVANDCDVLAGGIEKLRQLDLCIDTVQSVNSWLDTLRTYAGCWVVPDGNNFKLVSDKPGVPIASFSHTAGNIQDIGSLKKRGVQNTPTVMMLTYRDISSKPDRDGLAVVRAAGVENGTVRRRESSISLPGITRYSQAVREATERLNKLLLNDLTFTLSVFDEGLALEVGDIITVSHPIGITDKPMRILGISGESGRYTLDLIEYDYSVYASFVTDAPTYADTSLDNPITPPAVTSVSMVEEVFQQQNGTYSSRWRVTWVDDNEYSYTDYYRAELWGEGKLIYRSDVTQDFEWPTPAIQEGINYTAKVANVSTLGILSDYTTTSKVALGKQSAPGNVTSMSAFEAGGRVYITWLPAIDIDIWKYEIRYSPVGGTWETAIPLDRVDALRLQIDQLPVGTWALYVKCVDSVGNYSVKAASANVTVSSDASAFLIDTFVQDSPTLTGMVEYTLHPVDPRRFFVTEDAVAFGTKYSAALSTYTNPMASYHASMTSTWLGESDDFGLDLGGQLTGTATVEDLSGTHISYIGTAMAAAPGTWTYDAGLSQKKNARFTRLMHESLTTSTMLVTIPDQTIRLDAIPREEVGSSTSSASGPVTITLENPYVFVKKLTITPQGTTARSVSFDNVVLGTTSTFDVYIFNDAGSKIASPFQWQFQGV